MKNKSTAVAEIIGVEEAAKLLGLYPTVVRYHAANGNLAGQKIGKSWVFRRADVIAFTPRKAGRPARPVTGD